MDSTVDIKKLRDEFPFLIGKLQTQRGAFPVYESSLFPFLIGKLQTRRLTGPRVRGPQVVSIPHR